MNSKERQQNKLTVIIMQLTNDINIIINASYGTELTVTNELNSYDGMVNNIQLSPEGEVNSGGYIPRREASRYISTALHRP